MFPIEHDGASVVIRPEREEDITAIHDVNLLAFRGDGEARLVENIRRSPAFIPELSLVALLDGSVVGHILFSRIAIVSDGGELPALALAPMAVRPEHQRRGIGSKLVLRGLDECRRLGHGIVIVLGHADYYPRFGFAPARPRGILPPYEVGDPYFMVRELIPGALDGVAGVVRYPAAFDGVG
jgi:putative acetyltransferase